MRPEADSPPIASPAFCVRCLREGPRGASLCPECGDRLALQGYCPVCDRAWLKPEGSLCPKHDLELTAGPDPVMPTLRDDEAIDWVTVGSFAIPMEAEVRRLRLEAEGIPTFLDGTRIGANAIYAIATGGIKLQVPRALGGEARVLLSQTWAIPRSARRPRRRLGRACPSRPRASRRSAGGRPASSRTLLAAGIAYLASIARPEPCGAATPSGSGWSASQSDRK